MKKSALVSAIERGKLEPVLEQLQNTSRVRFSELIASVCAGNVKIFSALLEHEGGKDAVCGTEERTGRSLLHFAAEFGSLAIVKALLDLGVNPTLKDKKGKTALDLAIEGEWDAIDKVLAGSMGQELVAAPAPAPTATDSHVTRKTVARPADGPSIHDMLSQLNVSSSASSSRVQCPNCDAWLASYSEMHSSHKAVCKQTKSMWNDMPDCSTCGGRGWVYCNCPRCAPPDGIRRGPMTMPRLPECERFDKTCFTCKGKGKQNKLGW